MKRILTLAIVLAVVIGIWGYAFEISYFAYLEVNAHKFFTPIHFIYSGLSAIIPMLAIILVVSLLAKFFSSKINEDDLKTVSEKLSSSKFSQEISLARASFIISLIFLALVFFNIKIPSLGAEKPIGIGFMFWLFIFFNMQLFLGSLLLSPPHSRGTIIAAFILAVSMCFSAGGIDAARLQSKSESTLRDDWLVKVYRSESGISVEAKAVSIPIPLLSKAFQWLEAK